MEETTPKATNGRRNNARPAGTKTTEPSTLCARVRAASGMTQEDFAREIKSREKTVRNYEKQQIIPTKGEKRDALETLARRFNVPIEEQK